MDTSNSLAPPPKLTRACRACIKAKRKCSFGLPKCTRCQEKGAACDYENQPLTKQDVCELQRSIADHKSKPLPTSLRLDFFTDKPLNPVPSPIPFYLDPPVYNLTADQRTLTFVNDRIKEQVLAFSQTGTTTFIHPRIPPSPFLRNLRTLINTVTSNQTVTSTRIWQHYMKLLVRAVVTISSALPSLYGYEDLLQYTQSLLLIQVLTLFIVPTHLLPAWMLETTEARNQLLSRLVRKLWKSAPHSLPSNLSHHDAYALAESVRRTLITCHEFQAQWSMYKNGFFKHGPFGASLPFDRRFELWDADDAQFHEAMQTMGQSQHAQFMVSWREFGDMFVRGEFNAAGRPFEMMLLVGARGLDEVEKVYGVDLA